MLKKLGFFAAVFVIFAYVTCPFARGDDSLPNEVTRALADIGKAPFDVIEVAEKQLKKALTTSEKAQWLYVLSHAHGRLLLPERALGYAEQGLSLISPVRDELYHYLQLSRADALHALGKSSDALAIVDEIAKSVSPSTPLELQLQTLNTLGYIQLRLFFSDKALENFQRGYAMAQASTGLLQSADFASMIGLVYVQLNDHTRALPFFVEAARHYQKTGAQYDLANTLYNQGLALLAMDQEDEGLDKLRRSTQLALEVSDLQGAAFGYQRMARYLSDKEKYDEALPMLEVALDIFTTSHNRNMHMTVLANMADIKLAQGEYNAALTLQQQAKNMASSDGYLPILVRLSGQHATIMEAMGRFQDAYSSMVEKDRMQQQMIEQQTSRRLLDLEARFAIAQKEAEYKLLEEQNLRQQQDIIAKQKQQKFVLVVLALLVVLVGLLLVIYNSSRHHRARLEILANHDSLTGLLTRRKIMSEAERIIALNTRHDIPTCLVVLDLDHFKQINDRYGHQAGDEVLLLVASTAQRFFRKTDLLGRIGGEEFMFVFPHTELADARARLTAFAAQLSEGQQTLGYQHLCVTFSAGLVQINKQKTLYEMIGDADKLLYDAKAAGRNRILS